jgi:hypothetical protein
MLEVEEILRKRERQAFLLRYIARKFRRGGSQREALMDGAHALMIQEKLEDENKYMRDVLRQALSAIRQKSKDLEGVAKIFDTVLE